MEQKTSRRVDVYRNLHDNCLSVKDMDTDSDEYGTVIRHVDQILIEDAEFIVRQKGRQKVIDTGVKNAHAFVHGLWEFDVERIEEVIENRELIEYNPEHYKNFVHVGTGYPVESADAVLIRGSDIMALNPTIGKSRR
jgi:hypothetical protein